MLSTEENIVKSRVSSNTMMKMITTMPESRARETCDRDISLSHALQGLVVILI